MDLHECSAICKDLNRKVAQNLVAFPYNDFSNDQKDKRWMIAIDVKDGIRARLGWQAYIVAKNEDPYAAMRWCEIDFDMLSRRPR